MVNIITNFIQIKRIDSSQKLFSLLFLQQHLNFEGTSQDFAEKLYLDSAFSEKIILELRKVELLVETGHRWKLTAEPQVIVALELLARAFEYPLTRQKLLDLITNGAS